MKEAVSGSSGPAYRLLLSVLTAAEGVIAAIAMIPTRKRRTDAGRRVGSSFSRRDLG
jgi:hypothetical protein